ncbi:hypothetical protein [Caulobacter sp. Root343]|uniref:hypothetical protein n=1 Tax=Caulobacter sp. Root343 TaxID=1736520 RepID=UPI0006FFD092|nr:hypothetical protein [Caulobacter sp. Root343]KQV64032.1 hypothetical protein ASC70_19575 [Caulobacter sp. Root343]
MPRPRTPDEDDRLAAVHEAAHAVFALGDEDQPIILAGAVTLAGRGFGAAAIGLDTVRLGTLTDPGRVQARQTLIWSFVAGGVAETHAAKLWNIPLTPRETRAATQVDYQLARQVLAEISAEVDDRQLAEYEADIALTLEGKIWDVVAAFAAELQDKRRLEAAAATALVRKLCAEHLADDPDDAQDAQDESGALSPPTA